MVGLAIHEEQVSLAKLQRRIFQTRVAEQASYIRMRSDRLSLRPVRGRCAQMLRALFGTVCVAAPKIKFCERKDKGPFKSVRFAPSSEFLTDRCISPLLRL